MSLGNSFTVLNLDKRLKSQCYDEIPSQNSFALVAGDDLEKCSLEVHGSRRHLPGGDVSVPGPRGLGGLVEALAADLKIVFNRREC